MLPSSNEYTTGGLYIGTKKAEANTDVRRPMMPFKTLFAPAFAVG
jgi:hypothetical protein